MLVIQYQILQSLCCLFRLVGKFQLFTSLNMFTLGWKLPALCSIGVHAHMVVLAYLKHSCCCFVRWSFVLLSKHERSVTKICSFLSPKIASIPEDKFGILSSYSVHLILYTFTRRTSTRLKYQLCKLPSSTEKEDGYTACPNFLRLMAVQL